MYYLIHLAEEIFCMRMRSAWRFMSKRNGPIRNRSLLVPFWPAKRSKPPSLGKQDRNGHDREVRTAEEEHVGFRGQRIKMAKSVSGHLMKF